MPRVGRSQLPPPLLLHLLVRMRERSISSDELVRLARWLDTEPEVPEGKWFKRFPDFVLRGEGEFVKTFLRPGQAPDGQELE